MRGIEIALLAFLAPATWAEDLVVQGERLFKQGRYAEAEKALEQSEAPRARVLLALTLAATERCGQAAATLRQTFERKEDPQLSRFAGLGLARCAVAAGRFPEAAATLATLERRLPEDPDVLYETARVHLKAFNATVERMFDQAPASFRVHQLSAEIFEVQGNYEAAVSEYRKAIEKAPQTLNLHYRLGRALLLLSNEPASLEAARRAFERELEINPRDAVAEYQIAQIFAVENETAAAAEHLERAVELDPDFAEALTALGRQRLQHGAPQEAIALLARAVELQPESEAAWYNLMLAYRNAGSANEALRAKQKLDELQRAPEGEFMEFLERIGERPSP